MSKKYLAETPILDLRSDAIQALIAERGWTSLDPIARIGAAYEFVRNEILFGYNSDDALPASRVLADGYGQCNTKGTLLMALLRALDIPCRFHGFTIDKGLQRGVVPELVFPLAPRRIIHSWVEVLIDGKWINLEGFILDQGVLGALQQAFPDRTSLCAYGAGTNCLQAPPSIGLAKARISRRPGSTTTSVSLTVRMISTRTTASCPVCAGCCTVLSYGTG